MKHVTDMIAAYLSGELQVQRRAEFEEHLAGCGDCRREAEEAREVWEMLGAVASPGTGTASVWPSVRARTIDRQTRGDDWFFGAGRIGRAGWAAAAVVAGLMLGILLPAGSDNSTSADNDGATAWLFEASWLEDSSWLTTEGTTGLVDILLGADLPEQENGS